MCGISGFFNSQKDVPLGRYYDSHLRLRHRGEDDEGFFVSGSVGDKFCRGGDTVSDLQRLEHIARLSAARLVLGHRRLSIIDLTVHGHQPMTDRSGRYVMVFNGEIYNYRELRAELETLGYSFDSSSDTEVLLAAFSQWGRDCFRRFNGMWAVAIYDRQDNSLTLCRDRYGIKPLYYAVVNGTLYFGSEVKFIIPFLPEIKMNEQRVKEYLVENLVDHHQDTMFQGVRQISPASWLVISDSGKRAGGYWQLPQEVRSISVDDAVDELSDLLTSSVEYRLRSDVPVGSLLSGGLDSTTIVCLVRKLLDNRNSSNAFECFSAVFHEEEYSEKRYVEDTVKQVGMPIHWVYPDPESLMDTMPDLMYHQEFPFRSLAVFSQWELMKRVSGTDIKVLLNGQGSDEIFGGYSHHLAAAAAEKARRMRLFSAIRQAECIVRERGYTRSRAALMVAYELIKAFLPHGTLPPRPVEYLNGWYRSEQSWQRFGNRLSDRLSHDLSCSALPEYLRYEDRNSMAFTLESRLPFLDHRLVEWAFRLPDKFKIDGCNSKLILRNLSQNRIPVSVSSRRDKMGFVSPQEKWQRGVLSSLFGTVPEYLEDAFGFVDAGTATGQLLRYMNGSNNNWTLVWRMLCLTLWHKRWFEEAV